MTGNIFDKKLAKYFNAAYKHQIFYEMGQNKAVQNKTLKGGLILSPIISLSLNREKVLRTYVQPYIAGPSMKNK